MGHFQSCDVSENLNPKESGRNLSGQLEHDMHQSGVVGRLPISLGWLEANLFRSVRGGLIETVAQTLHYAHNTKLAGSFENYLEHHFTFNAETSSFRCVRRSRFEDDFRGKHLAGGIVGLRGAK